jgi:hypothetical protein
MNKCKNNDESVIFPKINPGKLPDFHETSFHVSSSTGRFWREVLGSDSNCRSWCAWCISQAPN